AEGRGVRIATTLPVGRGMGSSAALAVALAHAVTDALEGPPLTPQQAYDQAMPLEREFHGNPSGVDVAVSCEGGCLWFQRVTDETGVGSVVREPVPLGPWSLVVLDSGKAGDTKELVAGVAARRPAIDPALERIGALVREARQAIGDAQVLGELLTENHALLRSIGVSTDELDGLVELALGAGARGAKLSGAGGGGIVIALVNDPAPVLAAAAEQGVTAFGCQPWQR
ncbi:MAG: mevalonate kinase, partial [Myxococcota bacterium]